ncbi:hypothetical protein L3Q82_005829 [Scortum barcoo]|uniref:Uncharacterized protein n=1 Tax=Scortum barcoo TaxID=214431 RepID=A0ACB8V9S1_9TELE|nr:hypothetical protein L3Q82_005829 [Scortum barcoo]
MEKGTLGEFQGKSLDEIEIEDCALGLRGKRKRMVSTQNETKSYKGQKKLCDRECCHQLQSCSKCGEPMVTLLSSLPSVLLCLLVFHLKTPELQQLGTHGRRHTCCWSLSALNNQQIYRESSLFILTETWLNHLVPDANVDLLGFTAVRADRDTKASGKSKGGGLIMYVNNRWCNPGHISVKDSLMLPGPRSC